MIVEIENYSLFIDSIYNYVIDTYEIIPREFELTDQPIVNTSIVYIENQIKTFQCSEFGKGLHYHREPFVFCSIPEIIAVYYIQRSIFGPHKLRLIETLSWWLPNVTIDSVLVKFNTPIVTSHLFPAYAHHYWLNSYSHIVDSFTYVYGPRNIGYSKLDTLELNNQDFEQSIENYTLTEFPVSNQQSQKQIMVRSRSPSPGRGRRSASPMGRRRKRRSSRSRSRSASPTSRRRTRGAPRRRRSRSRSSGRR